jgi:hypothetical protein
VRTERRQIGASPGLGKRLLRAAQRF